VTDKQKFTDSQSLHQALQLRAWGTSDGVR